VTSSFVLPRHASQQVRRNTSLSCSVRVHYTLGPACTDRHRRDSEWMAARRKRSGTRTRVTSRELAKRSPALFERPAAGGKCWTLGCCLWWWERVRARCLHRPQYRHACLGSRGKCESRWLPYLCRDKLWDIPPALRERAGCGQRHHLFSDGTERRDAVLLRSNSLRHHGQREHFLERSFQRHSLSCLKELLCKASSL